MQNVWVECVGFLMNDYFQMIVCLPQSVFGWLVCASEKGVGVSGGVGVTSKAAFYLPVIIIADNLSIRRLGGVS